MSLTFRALVIRRSEDRKTFTRAIESRTIADLPEGELLVRVKYSSLNYKDGLSCIGNPGVTRRFPHTPGIDAAGVVEASDSSRFPVGSSVVVVGTALGMSVSGGLGQYVRIPASWAVLLPEGLSLRESMIYGTAGFTAALAVHKLLSFGVNPERGHLVVTGASGGVGSISVALLARLGFSVAAVSGKLDSRNFLLKLGAHEVLERGSLSFDSEFPLLPERWAGGIDTVGGSLLGNVLKTARQGAAIAATGLVASQDLPVSLLPFILRGVSLLGVNAESCPMDLREQLWEKLANGWRPQMLSLVARECAIGDISSEIDKILAGQIQGRVVVDMH